MPSAAYKAHSEPLSVNMILCKGDRQKALEAMHRRQHHTPKFVAMQIAEGDPILTALTMLAYQRPIQLVSYDKMKVINRFADEFLSACLEFREYDQLGL